MRKSVLVLSAALVFAAVTFLPAVLKADPPEAILCDLGEKVFPIPTKSKDGNGMRDAIQACLEMGGHPAGVKKDGGEVIIEK